MNGNGSRYKAVLFDLDGTLVDSAPDLIAAMDRLRAELGEPPCVADAVRRVVSRGGRAMLRAAFPEADEARIEILLPRFLEIYSQHLAAATRPYDGVTELLAALEAGGLRWGIVTNKAGWLARPLLERLGLAGRCAALVAGDCLPVRKPDPAPVRHACALAGLDPGDCLFVGDDRRDIEAGHGAGTVTVAAAWGYLDGEDPADWGADHVLARPADLLGLLGTDR